MAYSTSNPPSMISQRVGADGGAIFVYKDGDDVETVTGLNYITNATELGMKADDRVIFIDTTNERVVDLFAISGATTGTASGMQASTVEPVGETSIALASAGTGTVLIGDIINFEGDETDYEVTTGDADISGGGTLVITPGLVKATYVNQPITIKSDVINLAGGPSQELSVSGAVRPGVSSVELTSAAGVVAATIADSTDHQGLFVVKNTSASGTQAHTLTLTSGTFDGTNNVATLNAPNECLVVWFDSAGNGTIVENVGSVGLS